MQLFSTAFRLCLTLSMGFSRVDVKDAANAELLPETAASNSALRSQSTGFAHPTVQHFAVTPG